MSNIVDMSGAPIETEQPTLSLDAYQVAAGRFQVKTSTPHERIFGLLEEVGEVAGLFKRMFRGDFNEQEAVVKLKKELGDVLWYVARTAADNGWQLSDVALTNLEKLTDRANRNVLQGSGDDR